MKLMIGYLFGGVGGIEIIFIVLIIVDGIMLLIINYDVVDLECDFDYVFNVMCKVRVKMVMINFFGFGGINVSFIFLVYIN